MSKNDREWLSNGLFLRNVKNAAKSVFGNFREYASFFAALFIMQTLLWLVCFTTVTNVGRERDVIYSSYDYHMEITNLTATDYAYISNVLVKKDNQTGRSYESYEWLPPEGERPFYTLRVLLGSGYDSDDESVYFYQRVKAALKPIGDADVFIKYYLTQNGVDTGHVQINYTPLYSYDTQTAPSEIWGAFWLCIGLGVMFVALTALLFSIRLNHYKFMYGIYMTCGAGFKRLYTSSIHEMMLIAAATLLPSVGAAVGLCAAVFGSVVSMRWWMVPLVLFINFITVLIAVRVPTRRLSVRPPIELIVAQDNSNMVSSPRRSFRIFGKTFPYHYELFSAWRFRTYLARLLVAAVMFTSVFICGIFISGMNVTDAGVMRPEFTVHADLSGIDLFSDSDEEFNLDDVVDIMDDAQHDGIGAVDGVSHTVWTNETSASSLASLMLIKRSMHSSTKYSVSVDTRTDEYNYAVNMFAYQAVDRTYIDTLCSLYNVDGDPYLVLEGGNNIIISDSVYNDSCFSFSPGDTVLIGKKVHGKLDQLDYLQLNDQEILKKMLERMTFVYDEYNVVAVVHGLEAERGFVVGMNWRKYLGVTGNTAISGDISVYLDASVPASSSETVLSGIRRGLNSYLDDYGISYTVASNYATLNRELTAARGTGSRTVLISVLLLLLSPIVWLFSQLLFYFKRENEMKVLRMLGAGERAVRGLYSFAGLIVAALASVTAVILSYIMSFTLFKLMDSWLPGLGFTESPGYVYNIPLWAILTAVAVSVVCAYVSSMIPYFISRRKTAAEAARQMAGKSETEVLK